MSTQHIHIHHFAVMAPTAIIEDVVTFYDKVLGLKPGFRPSFSVPGYWLYAGEHPLVHLTAKEDRPQGSTGYFHHIALRCQNIDQVIQRLENEKIPYRKIEVASEKTTQLIVSDPAGTPIELNFLQSGA